MGKPPSDPAVKVTSVVLPVGAIVLITGAAGIPRGVPVTGAEAGPGPSSLTAVNDTAYSWPLSRPVMTTGDVACGGLSA